MEGRIKESQEIKDDGARGFPSWAGAESRAEMEGERWRKRLVLDGDGQGNSRESLLVSIISVREMTTRIFRWEGELKSKDEDHPVVWLSQECMSRCTCQVGLLRSEWFGG